MNSKIENKKHGHWLFGYRTNITTLTIHHDPHKKKQCHHAKYRNTEDLTKQTKKSFGISVISEDSGDSITCAGDVTRIRDTGPGLLGPTASLPPRNELFLQDPPTRAASAPLRRPRDPTLPFAIACAAAMATA
jgi:hypothetical protein